MARDILVDGYNVIKTNLMFRAFETKELSCARDVLVQQLKNKYRLTEHRVMVVFDGNEKREQVRHDDHICIIFSQYGETADSVIIRLATQARLAGREVEMYSNDGEVRSMVAEEGGNVQRTRALTKMLYTAPDDVVQRVTHRQKIRRIYGLDPKSKWEEDEKVDASYGRKKKKRSRRQR
jgi:hypothetical protein